MVSTSWWGRAPASSLVLGTVAVLGTVGLGDSGWHRPKLHRPKLADRMWRNELAAGKSFGALAIGNAPRPTLRVASGGCR